MIFLLLTGALACSAPVYSQKTNQFIDSLETTLRNRISDSLRVSILTTLSSSYTFIDFKKGLQYAKDAVNLAERINDNLLKLKTNRQLALAYSLGGDYTSALTYENKALEYGQLLNDSTEIGTSFSNIGNFYHELGVYDEAYFYLTRAYSMLKTGHINHEDSVMMNIAIHNVGRVFKELGQYDIALQHLRLSRKTSYELKDNEGSPYSLDEIGDVMMRQGKYDSALNYLQHSLNETRQLIRDNPGTIVKELQTKTLYKIAMVFMFTGQEDKALAYFDSTYTLHKITNNQFGLAEVQLGRGILYLRQNDFIQAEEYFSDALTRARLLNARILEIKCYEQLARVSELTGDYKKALSYFKQYKVFNDSLFSSEMQQKLYRDQVRFATEAKDEQIESLIRQEEYRLSEIRKQELIRNVLVVVMALSGILLFTVYRSSQRRKQINKLLIQHQEEMKKRSQELEQLNQVKDKFFSIISHDLRSPINALAGVLNLIDKGAIEPHELPETMRELRNRFNYTRTLLNNLLDWTLVQMDKMTLRPSRINIHRMVAENIEMIQSLDAKKIEFVNSVPAETFGFADKNTINLVIRNLISNAQKFTNEGGKIEVSAQDLGKEWVLAVSDTGIGMNQQTLSMLFDKINPYSTRGTANEKGTGLGLILCKEFVDRNNGRIWAESAEGAGSTFRFTIPKSA
ncbi:MAG: tetratricopeptide repeat-containing sensor histidine kinase [Cyclobacteriaceae bacterium]|nr:tetratricopeptide repeat-containing sensor histidine kinase [Cyclobacteriaceae bacterium]